MADTPLIDIFDLCVERLASGETVEDCLRDYPAYAEELRGLLETGFLVFQAQADSHNEQQAQAQTRLRIEEALQTDFAPHKGRTMSTDLEPRKKKNTTFTMRRTMIGLGGMAAAVFTFTLGFTFALSGPQLASQSVADASFRLTATAFVAEATAIAQADSDEDGLSNIRESAELGTDPYKYDTDGDGLSDGEEVNSRGTNPLVLSTEGEFELTATAFVFEVTQTAQAILANASATPLPAASATMTATVTTTATTTPLPTAAREFSLPTMAPVGTVVPEMGAPVGGDTAITGAVVVTSVALYDMMTPTVSLAMESSRDKDKNLGETSTIVEAPASADELEREASADGFAEGRIDATVPLPDPALSFAPTIVSPGDVRGLVEPLSPINMQQQLDPMKAGEIDDNAEWDTYAEFRRNYVSSYGAWTVIDRDVSGRRIIKVTDALGQPILGARVVVSMDQLEVSNTYTYATGMTLFFPNALEDTKRRDEFQIVVSYDQYRTSYTLDLRKVGDIIEIQMPIVIVRDPSVSLSAPTSPNEPPIGTSTINEPPAPPVPPTLLEATLVPETMSTPIIR